ncbi:TonB-dependent receptor domain-containing protein [Foetidibacter luteolus]|uniref:TonB-dependent receptor domain-containing protein n=1 Tax=Foetidibacter luteolus TaxID=2608880 RepID=UPI001A99F312|nr:TonB-dependent receptor [Foetidibacter luteolus]
MKVLLLSILLCGALQTFAQITGKLIDNMNRPVAFANVLLLKQADSTLIKAGTTDDQGAYSMDSIATGKYLLRFMNVGYETSFSATINILDNNKAINLGTHTLQPIKNQLNEVVVRSTKPLYQQRPDGVVVNVESSVLTKGSSALEVLERSPGVFIDHRNNSIALNGKSGVTVMINGKLMRLQLTQLIDLLNSISANDIEKIELLTTPPARYDAEGSAGIINIVLKKNSKQGTHGAITATAGYGWREKATTSASFDHNNGKSNVYGAYSFSHDRGHSDFSANGTEVVPIFGAGTTSFEFWNETKPVRNNHNINLGIDADINTTTRLGVNVLYGHSHNSTTAINQTIYNIFPDSLLWFNGIIQGRSKGNNLTSSLFFEKQLNEKEKLEANLDYLRYSINNPTALESSFVNKDGHGDDGSVNRQFAPVQQGFSNTIIQVGVAKMDYSRRFSEKVKLESGFKVTYTSSSSISGIESLVNGVWLNRPETVNDVAMRENIAAAYTSLNLQVSTTTGIIAGLRYEHAHTLISDGKTSVELAKRRLGVFFPSLFISHKLSGEGELQFSYTKRISRPAYNDLTSFVAYNDPLSVFTGNPLLQPTITNNIKLGYVHNSYSASLLFSRDKNGISQGQLTPGPDKKLVYVSPQNIDWQNNITLEAILPFKPAAWWAMTFSLYGGWKQYKITFTPQPLVHSFFSYSGNFSQSFKLPGKFSAELSGWYNSAVYGGNAKVYAMGTVNTGIKKELSNNAGTLQLSVTDVFRTMNTKLDIGHLVNDAFFTRAFVDYNAETRRMPIIKLTYSKSFGNTAKSQRRQNSGASDESERIRKN